MIRKFLAQRDYWLGQYLLFAVLAAVLPIIGFGAYITYQVFQIGRDAAAQRLVDTTRVLVQEVDAEIGEKQEQLALLAQSESLAAGDLAGFHRRMARAVGDTLFSIALIDPTGQQIASTLRPYGEPLPRVRDFAHLEPVFARGERIASDVFIGALAHGPITVIAVPVRDASGKVTAALSATLATERIANMLEQAHLPGDWVVSLLDRSGTHIARTQSPERFVGKKVGPDLAARLARQREGMTRAVTLEGIPVMAAFSTSAKSGWTVAIGVPEGSFAAPFLGATWRLAAGQVAFIALAMLLAWLIARRIARPMRELRVAAAALGRGETPVTAESGVREVTEIGAALQDAALLLREREHHQRAENRLRQLFEQAPGFMTMLRGPNHVFELVNAAYYQLVGHRDIVGKGVIEALPEVEGQGYVDLLDQVYASGKPFVGKEMLMRLQRVRGAPLEDRYIDFLYHPIVEADGATSGIFVQGIDVTERRNAEAELRDMAVSLEHRVEQRTRDLAEANRRLTVEIVERERAQEQLRQVQKMEMVGQLTGGVAHDFNNLLTAVLGNLDMLDHRASGEMERKLIRNAIGAAQRGAKLTEQLLAFARKQRLLPQATDLNSVISGMGDLLHRTLGGTVGVNTHLSSNLWRAVADPHQLELAILNLAVNARDAMSGAGSITIETRNAMAGETGPTADLPPGEYVVVQVSDTGAGMAPDVVARAFEPFFTTKGVGKGTGLGLSMVYGLLRQLGGDVAIKTGLGVGTTVSLYLPRAHEGAFGSAGDQGPNAAVQGGGTVLLADDDDDVRQIAAGMLRELGYVVLEANSGSAAVRLLEAGDRIDLLLVDYAMPDMTGVDVVRQARGSRPDLRILFMTGYADASTLDREAPHVPVINKPFRMAEFSAAVRAALTRVVSPSGNVLPLRPPARSRELGSG